MSAKVNNNIFFVYYFGFLGYYFSVRFFACLKNIYFNMRSKELLQM